MAHQVFHIEDETEAFQGLVYGLISRAEEFGVQLTSLDFVNDDQVPMLDGIPADQWVEAMKEV